MMVIYNNERNGGSEAYVLIMMEYELKNNGSSQVSTNSPDRVKSDLKKYFNIESEYQKESNYYKFVRK